jgi:hypothetical protein
MITESGSSYPRRRAPSVPFNAVSVAWSPDGSASSTSPRTGSISSPRQRRECHQTVQDKPGIHWHDPAWDRTIALLFAASRRRTWISGAFPSRQARERMTKRAPRCVIQRPDAGRSCTARTGRRLRLRSMRSMVPGSPGASPPGSRSIFDSGGRGRHAARRRSGESGSESLTVPVTGGVVDEVGATRVPLFTVRAIRPRWDPILCSSFHPKTARIACSGAGAGPLGL